MRSHLETARRDAEIRASSESAVNVGERLGLTRSHVNRIRAAAPARTRKERFQLEVIEGGWTAACMEPDEWDHWLANNPVVGVSDDSFADRPCRDCPLGFAIEMRALDRCNGTPTGVDGEPADHSEEEDDVIESRPSGGGRAQQLALTPPPCDNCQHEPICVLKIALKKATTVDVGALPLPDGLSVQVSAVVDCRFYTPIKKPRREVTWSPEQREAARQRAIANPPRRRAAS